jgi:hypothetical protein
VLRGPVLVWSTLANFEANFIRWTMPAPTAPYDSLMEAAGASGLFAVSSATTSIWVDPIEAKVTIEERIAVLKAADEANRLLELQHRKGAAEEP